ncbi:MAG: PIN domain-containing protein [Planctomycetaceae bacterium]
MRVLLDLNVLMDFLLKRASWCVEADAIWNATHEGRLTTFVSAASLPTVFYLARKAGTQEFALNAVQLAIETPEVVPVDFDAVNLALAMPGKDFEDNLQIACAVRGDVEAIFTRNPSDFTASPIPVMSPTELLRAIA